MFTKFVSKKIQETLNAKDKTLSRQTLHQLEYGGNDTPFKENPSASSYKSIKNIASRSIFLRMISNKKDVDSIVIAGGERDGNGKLKFGFGEDGVYRDIQSTVKSTRVETVGGTEQTIEDYEYFSSGIRPIAGIKSVDISYKGGFKALREANISWVIGSLEDLERLTPHFLTVGKTIMIDWGWVNKDSKSLQEEYGQKLFYDETNRKVDKSIFTNPQKRILDIGGNYGAMGGIISNFDYQLREDGGFDCNTKIISMGSPLFQKPIDKGISSKALLAGKKKEKTESEDVTVAESQMDSLMLTILNLREIIIQKLFKVGAGGADAKAAIKAGVATGAKIVHGSIEDDDEGLVIAHRNGEILWSMFHAQKKPYFLTDFLGAPAAEDIWVSWGWFEDHILNRYISYVGDDDEVKLTLRSIDTVLDENNVPLLWDTEPDKEGTQASELHSKTYIDQDIGVKLENLTETIKSPTRISNHKNLHAIDVCRFLLPGQSSMKSIDDKQYGEPFYNPNMKPDAERDQWRAILNWIPEKEGTKNPESKVPEGKAAKSTMEGYYGFNDPTAPDQTRGILRNVFVNIKEIQIAFGINVGVTNTPEGWKDILEGTFNSIFGSTVKSAVTYNSSQLVHVNDLNPPSTVEAGIKALLAQLNSNFFDIWDFELTSDPYDTTNIKVIDKNLSDSENKYTEFDEGGNIKRNKKKDLLGVYKFPSFTAGSMVKNQNLSFKIPNAMALTAMYGSNRNLKSITRDEQHDNSDLMTLFGNDTSDDYTDNYLEGLESTHRAIGWGQKLTDNGFFESSDNKIGSDQTSENSKIIKDSEDGVSINPLSILFFKFIDDSSDSSAGNGIRWFTKIFGDEKPVVYTWHEGRLRVVKRLGDNPNDIDYAEAAGERGYYTYDTEAHTYLMDTAAVPVIRNVINGEINNKNQREEIYNHHLLLPADLSLEIDGIEGILPGDIIHTDYISRKYNHSIKLDGDELGPSTFFQVFGINHKIGVSGWSTELTTKMRMNKDVLNVKATSIIDQLKVIPVSTGVTPMIPNNLDVMSNAQWMDVHGRPTVTTPSETEDIETIESLKVELEKAKSTPVGIMISRPYQDENEQWKWRDEELTQEMKDREIAKIEEEIDFLTIQETGYYDFMDMEEYSDEVMYGELGAPNSKMAPTEQTHMMSKVKAAHLINDKSWGLDDYDYLQGLVQLDRTMMVEEKGKGGEPMWDEVTQTFIMPPPYLTHMVDISDTPGETTVLDPTARASHMKAVNMAFEDSMMSEDDWNMSIPSNIGFDPQGHGGSDVSYTQDPYVDIYGNLITDQQKMEEFTKAVGQGMVSTIPEMYLMHLQKMALDKGHPPLFMTVPPSLTGANVLKGGIEMTEYSMAGKVGQVHGTQAIYDTKIMEELDRLVAEGKGIWRIDKSGKKTYLSKEEFWSTDGKPYVDLFSFENVPNSAWKWELSEENRAISGLGDPSIFKNRTAIIKDVLRNPKKMNYFALGRAAMLREEFKKHAEQSSADLNLQEADEELAEMLQGQLDKLLSIHPYGKEIQSTGTTTISSVNMGIDVAKTNARLNWEQKWYTDAGIGNAGYRRLIDDPTIDLNVIDPPGFSSNLIGYTNPEEKSYTGVWTISRDPASEYKSSADDMLTARPAETNWTPNNPTEFGAENMLMSLAYIDGAEKELIMQVTGFNDFVMDWAAESDVPYPIIKHILGNKDLNLVGFKFVQWVDFTIGNTAFSGISQTPNGTWVAKPEFKIIIPPDPPDIEYNIDNTPGAYDNV